MNIKEFLDQAWCDHDKKTAELIEKLPTAVQLLETESDAEALTRLIFHTYCEHQQIPERGTSLLEGVKHSPQAQSDKLQKMIHRLQVTLKYMTRFEEDISEFSIGDRTLIFAQTAASLMARNEFEKAVVYLNKAISASISLDHKDVAFKILAMTTNNIASGLEEKNNLDEKQMAFMVDCAYYARKFWEIAGTWIEVERAEYRISSVLLKVKKPHEALKHAQNVLSICQANKAEPFELFFANEALARVYQELNHEFEFKTHFDAMATQLALCSEKDRSWMQGYLDKLVR